MDVVFEGIDLFERFLMKLSTGHVSKRDFDELIFAKHGYNAAEAACNAAWVPVINALTAELESIRDKLLEAFCISVKEAGRPCNGMNLNVWAGMFLRVTETLRSQSIFVQYPCCEYLRRASELKGSLISLNRDLAREGFLGGEHPNESGLQEAKRRLDAWHDLVRKVERRYDLTKPPPSDVNTVESAPGLMPVKEGIGKRELTQLAWDGTCAAWGKLEAAGVAVLNEVTAELEAMREELLEGLCQALHGGGGAGNDYASSLRKDMLKKVTESLSKQQKLIKQAESQQGPRRSASEHPFHATCVSAIDYLIALQRALPMEFYLLPSPRPKRRTASDLQEMKEHLKEPLSVSSDWGSLWEDRSWREILDSCGLRFDAAAKNDSLTPTPVKELIEVLQDRRPGILEETAPSATRRATRQKEIGELRARCDDLEERCEALAAAKAEAESKTAQDISTLKAQYESLKNEHEALKSSLNAEASKAFAHRAWKGHGGLSLASPPSLSSWKVVASGSGGSQTILSTSWISVATSGPCCFLKDAIFKIKKEDGFDFCEARDLQMGSKVVAENGEIIEAKTAPEHHVVHEMVELQTESACLQVSPDHQIVRPDKSAVPRQEASVEVMSSLRK